jgi:hypothetical protein
MSKSLYKGGKWWNWKKGNYQPFNDDKNVVKVVKPEGFFIPIHVTTGIYQPSTKELTGKKVEVINLANVEKYCESEIFGKKEVRTSIVMAHSTVYVLETWNELDKLVEAALAKYNTKPAVK